MIHWDSIDWNAVTGASAAIGSVVVLFGAIIANIQLYELRKTRRLETLLPQFEKLDSTDARKARRLIYGLSPDTEFLSREQLETVQAVTNMLNQAGFLMSRGLIDREPSLEMFHVISVRCWYQLRNVIRRRREVQRTSFMHHFQWLALQCVNYWIRAHPEERISVFNPDGTNIREIDPNELLRDISADVGAYRIP